MKTLSLLLAFSLVFLTSIPQVGNASNSVHQLEANRSTEFEQLRERWANYRVPNDHINMDNPIIKENIDQLIVESREIWETMNTDNPDYLWENIAEPRNSGHLTGNYRNLRKLAEAYQMEVSPFYQNQELLEDIIYGLDWMEENRYNNKGIDYGNWWDFQIGAPQALNDTVVLVYDFLTDEQIDKYMGAVKTFVPDPTVYYSTPDQGNWELKAVGANLVDLIKVVVIQGIISEEEDRILQGRDAFPTIEFKTSGTGDGLYFDGSFIDHTNIAYTGTYGSVLLGNMLDMNYLLAGSLYALSEDDFSKIYEMILKSFQPVIYRGLMMDMVNGRAISRDAQNIGYGVEAIEHIIQYTDIAPPEYKQQFERMVKEWLLTGDNVIDKFKKIPVISLAKDIISDETIVPQGELIGHYNFANMDRVVHRGSSYVFALSMYSNRIGAYEGNMNGENLKGHYTGSGMTYLYNNDLSQYGDNFWATVDLTRLPGITVDPSQPLIHGVGTGKTSPQSWVGGTTMDGLYGVSGMYLDQTVFSQSLKGKKSWFMFDDEIVALGSDINSNEGSVIETVVENRKINNDGNNPFIIDGEQMNVDLDWEYESDNTKWAHLTGNVRNSDLGYYFPEEAVVNFKREERIGDWKSINDNGSNDSISRNYLQMTIDHGVDPSGGSYQYVLLPNKTAEDTASYAESPDIEILINNDKVQAVRENKLNMIGANFWENNKTTVDRITSYHKASIMAKETLEKTLEISVTDPTHENQDVIMIELDYRLEPVLLDPRVEVIEQTLRTTTLAFHVNGALGDSIEAEFNILPKNPNDMLNDFSQVFNDYVESNLISKPLVNKLKNMIRQAIKHENKERPLQAITSLENILKHIDKEANIEGEVKADLIVHGENIIEVIHYNVSGPSGDLNEPIDKQPDNDEVEDFYRLPIDINNGSFEEPSNDNQIPGWKVALLRNASFELSNERAYDGNTSLKLMDHSTDGAVIINSKKIPVVPGAEYNASFQVYLEDGRTSAEFHMYNEDGEKVSNNPIYIDSSHGDWQEINVSVIAPENAAYAEFGAVVTYQWMGVAYYDAFELTTDAYEKAPEIIGKSGKLYTSNTSPLINIKGKENGTVYIYEEDEVIATDRLTGGDQTIQLAELTEGEHHLTIKAFYDDGRVSIDRTLIVIIDTIAPAAPIVISPQQPVSTYDRTPTIVLKAEPASIIYVKNKDEIVGIERADENGDVSVTTQFLSKGVHTLHAFVVDQAGNESERTDIPKIIINNGKNIDY